MVNRQVNRREKGGRGGFDYRPSDPKKLKERAEAQGGAFDSYFKSGFDLFKPKVGDNAVRICPPTWKGHDHFGYEIWVHGYIGSDKSSYLCPKRMKNKPCPICEAAAKSTKAGEKDEGDDIKAKKRVVYWVMDREGDSSDPELWSVSWTMDKDISGRCEKRSGKILELDNPWDGHDVTFRRTGTGLKTRYPGLEVDSDKTPLADRDKDVERILEFVKEHPLDSVLKFYPYEHLAAVIDGTNKEKDDDLDEDEDDRKSSKRRSRDDDDDEDEDDRKSSKRRGRDRDDDEDEDEDRGSKKRRGRDDDDDEDEKPKRRKSRDDDDEDEDDKPKRKSRDDDDNDEDEKPKRRKSRDDDDDEDDEPKKKRRSRDDDEDDPADEDDDKGDDDDDRKSKKRRGRDDDEDEDDEPKSKKRKSRDEDEEDEIPSSRRAKRNRD